uniref:Ferritin n=1 Tax=Crassostrea virginica TaxID=6565 RepID=A0A8B8EWJ0_CRAVI|nr:ferritin, lower subunit-like [Crassostrea virginica]
MRVFVTALFGLVIALLGYHGTEQLSSVKASRTPDLGHVSLVEQNFAKINRKGLNKLITDCFNLYYQYLAMSNYFGRADVALPGFQKYFAASSEREETRAKLMMEYINKRGGTLSFLRIKSPVIADFSDGKSALDFARKLSRQMNAKILNHHQITTTKYKDPNLKLFYDEHLVDSQVELIKSLGDMITRLERMQKSHPLGLALYMFDQELQK